jgi:hypothetical protein
MLALALYFDAPAWTGNKAVVAAQHDMLELFAVCIMLDIKKDAGIVCSSC